MMRFGLNVLIAAALLPAAAVAQSPAGDANHGKELFLKYSCYACHGFSGQNGPGARLVPMKMPQAAFIGYVRNPPRPNLMPSYSPKVLADKDLADVYAYIKTLPDSDPAVRSIPLLSALQP
jgi:mono/diheme cytochrome c family protein